MPAPSKAPIPNTPTPAALYILSQRLVRRYELLVSAPAVDIEALLCRVWRPDLSEAEMYGTDETDGFLARVDEGVPELIRLMGDKHLRQLHERLDAEAPDLPGLIRWVLDLGQRLQKPEHDPRLKLDDAHLAKLAFAGGLTEAAYRQTHDPAHPSARWLRRQRENARKAEREGRPVVVVAAPAVPTPQMLYLLPNPLKPKPRPGKRGYVATGAGLQLAFGF